VTAVGEVLRVLHLYWTHERRLYQFLLVNALAVPATIAYLGWRLIPDDPERLRWWLAGSVAFGLGMGGFAQVGFAILNDRFLGRLDLVRSAPVSKRAYLCAQVAVGVLESLALVWIALLGFAALGVAELTVAGLAAALATGLLAGAAMGGLATAIAFRAPGFDEGNTAVAMTALGLAAASPVFYDIDALPRLLHPVAWLSPFTHVAPLLRAVLAGQPPPPVPLVATGVLAVALVVAGYRLARWSE
jgi:ABC-type polysaccharide/polyol phosphate export permease